MLFLQVTLKLTASWRSQVRGLQQPSSLFPHLQVEGDPAEPSISEDSLMTIPGEGRVSTRAKMLEGAALQDCIRSICFPFMFCSSPSLYLQINLLGLFLGHASCQALEMHEWLGQ